MITPTSPADSATSTPESAEESADAESIAPLAARLRLVTTRLARRMRSEADAPLTPTLISALVTVHHHGPLTLGEVAERERVARPSVTKIVGRLEEQGLVVRETDDADRRIARVRTTRAGDAMLAASRERKNAWLAARLAELDHEALLQLADVLDTLEHLASTDSTDSTDSAGAPPQPHAPGGSS